MSMSLGEVERAWSTFSDTEKEEITRYMNDQQSKPEFQEAVRRFIAMLEGINPKIWELAKRDKRVGELGLNVVAKIPDVFAEYLKVPGHRGRHQDSGTARRVRVVTEHLQHGLNPSEIIRHEHPDLLSPEKAVEFERERQRLRAFIRYHKLSPR